MCHSYVCVCSVMFLGSIIWHTHAQRERLQHHKILSGQGTVAREAATACLNSSDTELTYLGEG